MTATTERSATLAELMHRIAYGMEILPDPLSTEYRSSGAGIKIHLYQLAEYERWRQWCGAPAVEPTEWTPSGLPLNGASRRYETTTEWRGWRIVLLCIEHRREPLTRAERRQQLVAELARLDGDGVWLASRKAAS
jgi:hypothetical protein